MDHNIVEGYIEKVYGYAVKHTYSREEADELAQEILFTAVRELPKLREESKFEPWLWGIARNVLNTFRRNLGKQRAMYSYDTLENLSYSKQDSEDSEEELYDFLRTKIAMLSAIYREIIILYYYDGLSTKTISEKLNVPEGTVRWRLSEARRKLKKECSDMNETALRPIKMKLDIYGDGNYNGKTIPFPTVYVDDALSQNILYHCYENAFSVEELAKLCGVPAYYAEERINNLLNREAVIEVSKGKYRTDFIIWSDQYGIYCEEHMEKALMPIMDEIIAALNKVAEEADQIDFYKAEKGENDLLYLYGIMAFSYAARYCKLPYPQIRKKYDGFEWCYIGSMETGAHPRLGIGCQHCGNTGGRGAFSHTSYSATVRGISFRQMMYENYINACASILYDGGSEDVDSVAGAIQDGYIIKKSDGRFFVTVPSFTCEQKAAFDAIADRYLAPLMPRYCKIVDDFIQGYKKQFPKHLSEDADRMCRTMFISMYAVIAEYAQRTGRFPAPSEHCYCDVMIQQK